MCCEKTRITFAQFYPLLSHLSEANSGVVAEIRVTKTTTEEGVTVMGTGTLPCSVLVHYSIISQ